MDKSPKSINGTFSGALDDALSRPNRVQAIAVELGDVEGKRFMEAMRDPNVKLLAIQKALKAVGVKVSHSTLGVWRIENQ